MIELKITANFDEIEKSLQDIYANQIPYVTAVSLTRLANLAKVDLLESLKRTFIIRNKYVMNSIKITPAKKTDWPYCSSVVGTKAPFMAVQVEGGEKDAKNGIPLGVPLQAKGQYPTGARTTPETVLGKAMWVRTLLQKHGFIVIKAKSGKEILMEQYRTGSRRNKKHNLPLDKKRRKRPHTGKRGWYRESLYALRRNVEVPSRWHFGSIVDNSVQHNIDDVFRTELFKAIESSR